MTIKIKVLPAFSDVKLTGRLKVVKGRVMVQVVHKEIPHTALWKNAEDHELSITVKEKSAVLTTTDGYPSMDMRGIK